MAERDYVSNCFRPPKDEIEAERVRERDRVREREIYIGKTVPLWKLMESLLKHLEMSQRPWRSETQITHPKLCVCI